MTHPFNRGFFKIACRLQKVSLNSVANFLIKLMRNLQRLKNLQIKRIMAAFF